LNKRKVNGRGNKMKKRMMNITKKYICVLMAIVSILTFNQNVYADNDSSKCILIDAGHGGIDGGASSTCGILEKDVNLKISKKLKEVLEQEGYKVLMTREEDVGLYIDNGTIRKKKNEDLRNRYNMKKESGCDMFISIHLNSFPEGKYSGAQVWYGNNSASKKLGHMIQVNLRQDINPQNNRVEKCAKNDYKILRDNDEMPAVIIECGFLSNKEECEKLTEDEYQTRLVQSISKSIKTYYQN
jgi:N-acetylmuramoyl-L-alanine amidase